MIYDEHNSFGTAPAKARSEDSSEETPPPAIEPVVSQPHELPHFPPQRQFRATIPEDLQVPWGWVDVGVFVIFGLIGGIVLTQGLAQVAVRVFGVNPTTMFGTSMSTAKSVVVLISQALLDAGAILFLYIMLFIRTPEPFWPRIGWRGLNTEPGVLHASAAQFLSGGAVLAVVVTFLGGFFNSKETLPIEQLLQARVSMLIFAILGVLVAPLVEETIFRGFLYPVVARRLGIAAGVAITGTLFGLMHAVQLWGGWGQIALLIFVGVVLTWVRARTGTVTASYFVHLGYNGLQLLGYVVYMVGGMRH